jgi:hypothetical protein
VRRAKAHAIAAAGLASRPSIRIGADAHTHGGDNPDAFRGALERMLAAL